MLLHVAEDLEIVGQRVPCIGTGRGQDQRAVKGSSDVRVSSRSTIPALGVVPSLQGTLVPLVGRRATANLVQQDFFLPSEAFDLIFLKAKIVILCTKGFEIMDLTEYALLLVSHSQRV